MEHIYAIHRQVARQGNIGKNKDMYDIQFTVHLINIINMGFWDFFVYYQAFVDSHVSTYIFQGCFTASASEVTLRNTGVVDS